MRRWFILLLCLAGPVAAETFEQALEDYLQGRHASAHAAFEQLARLGNSKAQLNLGVMHVRGEHVPRSLTKAWAWAKVAESHGDSDATGLLRMLSRKMDEAAVQAAQQELAALAAVYGPQALQAQARALLPARDMRHVDALLLDAVEPQAHLRDKGLSGTVAFQFMVDKDGTARYLSPTVASNAQFEARCAESLLQANFQPATWQGKAVRDFSVHLRFNVAPETGEVKVDALQAYLDELRQKAEDGYSQERFDYAFISDTMHASYQSLKGFEAVHWGDFAAGYLDAARSGLPVAMYYHGLNRLTGRHSRPDTAQGLFWLHQAAQHQVPDAAMLLGGEYLVGGRVDADLNRALELLKFAAEAGNKHARLLLVWTLVTHPAAGVRNLASASQYFADVSTKDYYDLRSYYETEAAVAIANLEWRQAEKALKKLHRINKRYGTESYRESGLAKAVAAQQLYLEAP